uniref:Uncharacterized protein n=1 Tax=Tetranychus urticae TaxID=32264 RepID=T1JSF9_TETUR
MSTCFMDVYLPDFNHLLTAIRDESLPESNWKSLVEMDAN